MTSPIWPTSWSGAVRHIHDDTVAPRRIGVGASRGRARHRDLDDCNTATVISILTRRPLALASGAQRLLRRAERCDHDCLNSATREPSIMWQFRRRWRPRGGVPQFRHRHAQRQLLQRDEREASSHATSAWWGSSRYGAHGHRRWKAEERDPPARKNESDSAAASTETGPRKCRRPPHSTTRARGGAEGCRTGITRLVKSAHDVSDGGSRSRSRVLLWPRRLLGATVTLDDPSPDALLFGETARASCLRAEGTRHDDGRSRSSWAHRSNASDVAADARRGDLIAVDVAETGKAVARTYPRMFGEYMCASSAFRTSGGVADRYLGLYAQQHRQESAGSSRPMPAASSSIGDGAGRRRL